jgi:hypothetical protein
MRRIATGLAMSGLGAVAATADVATYTWVTKNGWTSVKGHGTYSLTKTSVSAKGYIQDYKNDGWSPWFNSRPPES